MWASLDIVVKQLGDKNNWANIPSDRYNKGKLAVVNSRGGKVLDSNGLEVNPEELLEERRMAQQVQSM